MKRKRGGSESLVPPLPGGRDLSQEPTPDPVADGTRQEGTEIEKAPFLQSRYAVVPSPPAAAGVWGAFAGPLRVERYAVTLRQVGSRWFLFSEGSDGAGRELNEKCKTAPERPSPEQRETRGGRRLPWSRWVYAAGHSLRASVPRLGRPASNPPKEPLSGAPN